MTLGKHRSKTNTLSELKPTDEDFLKKMMEFINGGFRSEFGVSVIKKSRHQTDYIMNNKYTKKGVFVNKFDRTGNTERKFGDYTPSFGGTWGENENENEEHVKTVDEMMNALKLMDRVAVHVGCQDRHNQL